MRWGINDFKGLKKADLKLDPGTVTVLAGMNSSGKSSLLQSLLFAAQSLYHNGPVILNGPLVRLGEAPDLVRHGSSGTYIGLSLDFDASLDDSETPTDSVRARIDLVPSGDNVTLRPQRVRISTVTDSESQPLRLDKDHSRTGDLSEVELALERTSSTDILHVKSLLGSDRRALRTYVSFSGLVPDNVIQLHSSERIEAKYRQAIHPIIEQLRATESLEFDSNPAKENEVFVFVREFTRLILQGLGNRRTKHKLHAFSDARNGNPYRFERAWATLTEQEKDRAVEIAVRTRSQKPFIRIPVHEGSMRATAYATGILEVLLEDEMALSVVSLREFGSALHHLANRVQYLGPLRDEPRVVWNQWNELARGLPVGTRGEHSAVMLSRSAKYPTEYVDPAGERRRSTLDIAVNEWLAYLQIGDSVSAKSQGKLGVGVTLDVAGQRRDLTAVGVGVSQALPLVIAFLASPPNAIFIVEQPELHLHPAVQSRLADFILNARPDLTTIVETHSETFLTRIRRRVAEGLADASRLVISFVEPSEDGAVTRNLEISEFGDLNEWPAGFLTSGEEDTAAILKANLARLRSKN